MRFLLLIVGFALGVAASVGYVMFVANDDPPPPRPMPQDPPITVMLGERFLEGIIRKSAIKAAPGVEVSKTRLQIATRPDVIEVHTAVDVLGQTTEGKAVLRPILRGGKLKVDVVETNVGEVPFPPMEQVIEEQINQRVSSLLSGLPVTITGVRVEPGRGVIVTCAVDLDRLEQVIPPPVPQEPPPAAAVAPPAPNAPPAPAMP